VGKTPKGDEDRYTYEELMDTCANIAADVATQGELIKQQADVIAQQKELLTKQGIEVEKLQKVVFHQFIEIQTLKKTVGRLMQERMQRQFVMHMRPPHVATTKGENVRMPTAAQTDSAAQQQAHASSTPVTTAVSEVAQTDSAVRTTAAPTTSTTPPTTQSVPTPTVVTKGVVIQEAKSSVQSKPTDSAAFKDKGKAVMVEPEKPLKKKAQIRVDEELARKLQEEEEDERTLAQLMETKSQLQRDEELARRLYAKELAELAKEKAAQRNKQLRAQKMTKTPSPAQAKRDQRRRVTNFLKNALGWPAQRFQRMSDARLTELYKRKQKKKLNKKLKKKQHKKKLIKLKKGWSLKTRRLFLHREELKEEK
jgi:hypothetical protein